MTRETQHRNRRLVVWEGPSELDGAPIVVIATWPQTLAQANEKTGRIVQTWIVRRDIRPAEAWRTGEDVSICGDCALRGDPSKLNTRSCYVHLGQVGNLWDAYIQGPVDYAYSDAHIAQFVKDRVVRLGAYGDPAAVPANVWRTLIGPARAHIGYTHQWRHRVARPLRNLVMASVDSPEEREEAMELGWRTFRTRLRSFGRPRESVGLGEIVCPAEEGNRRTTCLKCRLCDGVHSWVKGGDFRRDITIEAHGHPVAYKRMREDRLRVLGG